MADNASPDDTTASETSADAPIFSALLVPYRSLGKRGFTILMAFLGVVSLGVE